MTSVVSAPEVTAVSPAETVEATSPSNSDSPGDHEPPTPPKVACFACKKRRITCDQSFPSCRKCAKKGIPCPGYTRPKIVWKVLKLHSVDSREWQRVDAGNTRSLPERSSAHGSGQASGAGRKTRNARPGKKAPLLDIGYTFKVDFPGPPAAPGALTPPESHSGSASPPPHSEGVDILDDDDDVEVIPRIVDPYNSSLDHGARETLTYYESKICLTLEYLQPLHYLSSLSVSGPKVSGGNPLKYLITEASQSPLLLHSLLAIGARHLAILLEGKGSGVGRPDPYGARRTYDKALSHHQKSIMLLRKRVTSATPANISEILENTGDQSSPIGPMDCTMDKSDGKGTELWRRDDSLMLMLLMLYYEMIDGGTGNGSWKWHLQFAKWIVEMREANGLGMGVKHGPDVSFLRVHFEAFDAVGSSFAHASRLFPQDIWLRPAPDKASNGLRTPSSVNQCDTYPLHPFQVLHQTVNDPDPVYSWALIFIPTPLLKIMHCITNLRRQNFLYRDHVQTQAHDLLWAALKEFDPELWSAHRHSMPIRLTPSGPERPASQYPVDYVEEAALGKAYHISVQIYFYLALALPHGSDLNDDLIVDKLATELIALLATVTSTSLLFRSMVWPTMVAGISAYTQEHMDFITYYGKCLRACMPCQGLYKGLRALERLWIAKPPAFHEKRLKTRGRRLDWEKTVTEFNGDWLVI